MALKPGQVRCKDPNCSVPIMWGITKSGIKVPLDSRATVYRVIKQNMDYAEVEKVEGFYVTHFATCKNPDKFSSSNKEKQPSLF